MTCFTDNSKQLNNSDMEKSISLSIGRILAMIIFLAGIILLIWNEYRTIRLGLVLRKAEKEVMEISSANPSLEGKLVHITGVTNCAEPLIDEETGVVLDAMVYKREVSYYQIAEYRDNATEMISYYEDWFPHTLSSQDYKTSLKDANFALLRMASKKDTCTSVALGGYIIPKSLLGWMRDYTDDIDIKVPEDIRQKLNTQALESSREARRDIVRVFNNCIYIGGNPTVPKVGDVKIEYSIIPMEKVSVLAKVEGDSYTKYGKGKEYSLYAIEQGSKSAKSLIAEERSNSRSLGWFLRITALVLITLGWFGSAEIIKSLISRV